MLPFTPFARAFTRTWALAVLSTTLVPSLVKAQTRAVRQLGSVRQELAEGFSNIAAVRELSDGRVLVLDRRDRILRVVDAAFRVVAPVGRAGDGPGEYRNPTRLIALTNDSTLLVDSGIRRMLLVLPGASHEIVLRSADREIGWDFARGFPRYADTLGALYALGSGMVERNSVVTPLDSAPVLRWDRKSGRVDTLANIKLPQTSMRIEGARGTPTSMNVARNPLAAQDEWVVAPDGRIALARVAPLRVDWQQRTGSILHGPTIAVRTLPVTDRDREVLRARTTGAGNAAAASVPDDWPVNKPPFLRDDVSLAPDGTVWLARTRAALDSTPRYDVFASQGQRTVTIALAPHTRVAGFGRRVVYLVRTDADDLEYLQRVPLAPR